MRHPQWMVDATRRRGARPDELAPPGSDNRRFQKARPTSSRPVSQNEAQGGSTEKYGEPPGGVPTHTELDVQSASIIAGHSVWVSTHGRIATGTEPDTGFKSKSAFALPYSD